MNLLLIIFIFTIVLFIYLHVNYYYKINNKLEIFELEKFDETLCNVRTPFIFNLQIDEIQKIGCSSLLKNNGDDKFNIDNNIKMPFNLLYKYINTEKNGITKNNNLIIKENKQLYDIFKRIEEIFKPIIKSSLNEYDIIIGSTKTDIEYSLNYLNYFIITEGIVEVLMTPYTNLLKRERYFDYENYKGKCKKDMWEDKEIKKIIIKLKTGDCLYIPNYWYYSFKFIEKNTSIASFSYRNIINDIAIIPYHILHYLQLQNIINMPNVKKIII
jgi:hypothetical protein